MCRADTKHLRYEVQYNNKSGTDDQTQRFLNRRKPLVENIISSTTQCGMCNKSVEDIFIMVDIVGAHQMKPHCFCEECYDLNLPAGGGLVNRERKGVCSSCPGGNHILVGSNAVLVVRSGSATLREKLIQGPQYRYGDERSALLQDAQLGRLEKCTRWTPEDSRDECKLDHRVSYPSVETFFSKLTYSLQCQIEDDKNPYIGTKMQMLSDQLTNILRQDRSYKILVLGREEDGIANSLTVAASVAKTVLTELEFDAERSVVTLFGGSSSKVTKDDIGKRAVDFQKRDDVRVCLLAMRSCYGLNLTSASHVISISPHLSPAIEEQAIARAIRIGSERETVPIIRLTITESFEYDLAKKRAAPEVQADAKLLWEQGKNEQLVKKMRTEGEKAAFMLPARVFESAGDDEQREDQAQDEIDQDAI